MVVLVNDFLNYLWFFFLDMILEEVDLLVMFFSVFFDCEVFICECGVMVDVLFFFVIFGIVVQLYQLFYNLLSNGLKFSDKMLYIFVLVFMEKGMEWGDFEQFVEVFLWYYIVFVDNGIGILLLLFDKIFMVFMCGIVDLRFFGMGIGLVVCKKVVENYYGYIMVESWEGEGIIFYVYFFVLDC